MTLPKVLLGVEIISQKLLDALSEVQIARLYEAMEGQRRGPDKAGRHLGCIENHNNASSRK